MTDLETIAAFERMIDANPTMVIGALARQHPQLSSLAGEIEEIVARYQRLDLSVPYVAIGLALGAGFIIGRGIDTSQPSAGLMVERMAAATVKLFRAAVEGGFTEAMKEDR